jgi:glycosyltransferase involved in cell wall biosynthesis
VNMHRSIAAMDANSQQDLVINGKFLSAAMTGVHRVAYEICNALADLADEQEPLLAGRKVEVWRTKTGQHGAEFLRLPIREVGPLAGVPWEQITLPARHDAGLLVNFCNMGPALSRNAVTMIHDSQVYLSPRSYSLAFRLWYKTLLPILGRRGKAVLTVSNYSRTEIARSRIAHRDRIHAIYNGVDHVLRTPSESGIVGALGLDGQPYALALANTQSHKNIGLLLQAFARPELAEMQLVLYGAANRADFIALGHEVPANVRFAGRVSDGEMRALMEAAAALAFPSRTEGFGLPPLEAMLLGTPSVCAPCGALPEVCADGALYAGVDSPQEWAETLQSLAAPSDFRTALIRRGQARAALFTWRRAAYRFLEILDMVEGKNGAFTQSEDRV